MSKLEKEKLKSPTILDFKESLTNTTTDRRIRARRLDVNIPVNISHKGNPIHGFAEAVNLSWSGMLLATNFPVAEKDEFTLEFTLPTSHIPIQVRARVVRIMPESHPDEPTYIGLMFMEMDTNISRMITGYVLEHLETF